MSSQASQEEYPPQTHSGKVGYGPHFSLSPTLGEKMTGLKEELKGTIKRDPEEVQHGKDIVSGEEKRRAREADMRTDPFAKHAGETSGPSQSSQLPHPSHGGAMSKMDDKEMREHAATVAPVGTDHHERQLKGDQHDFKHYG
ncbi:hypothetical protein EST38_g8315 [Candolleomyces aberdarensis]|uniref:Uncharacterized protein n=1 Tax=Candolleomyces aberdarensis TaxID=2316362 RepID=A0A4Q2DDI3_9AGAR|nr:hypothetical protein EST38_g8315 [Candolleomyces aberdarensis]